MSDSKKPIKIRNIIVGAGNIFSQLFFIWLFKFIWIIRRDKDFKNLNLILRDSETSHINDDILEKKWKEEMKKASENNRYLYYL